MKIHVADAIILNRILSRKRKSRNIEYEIDLIAVLREILNRANEFVPSECGSILLDDPLLKMDERKPGKLYFLACFGKGSASLAGTCIQDDVGIAGTTYQSGKSYISKDAGKDTKYHSGMDRRTAVVRKSVICSPIVIDESIIGVIELINRKSRVTFDKRDLALLDIFAGYTATLFKNALDARRFEELSKRDNLTGLYNDRYLFKRLFMEIEKAMEFGGDLTIIFFDLDHFKEVNDTKGHLAGSRVLKEIGMILEDVFRDTNAVLARYGGDEYIILMPDTNQKKAGSYAEQIRERIAGHTFLKTTGPQGEPALNLKGVITCSIGVASLASNIRHRKDMGKTVEALIKAADSAMYRAKDGGKNRLFFAQEKT